MPRYKALTGLKITDESEGKVTAVFATLNVVDSDGDVTVKGAFEDGAAVLISAYNHQSWKGALPVGRGTIKEDGDTAVLDGQFFMNTQHGRDTFETVKATGELQEWSYGFDVVDAEKGVKDDQRVQFLKKLKVHEVSPVILGAGVATRTVAAKGKQLNSDLARRLRDAGKERFGGDETYVWLDDFDTDDGWAVFCVETDDAVRHVQVPYTRDGDDTVTLADDETDVERTTAYSPKGTGPTGAPKLRDQGAIALTQVKAFRERLADAVAQRVQDGRKLADDTLGVGAELVAELEGLREALAIEAPESKQEWREAKRREAIARLRHAESLVPPKEETA